MDRKQFNQDVKDANYAGRKAGLSIGAWIIISILFFGAMGVAVWYFQVATSDVKGAGDAQKQVNSSANRLQAQDKYNKLYTGIQAADRNINTLAETYRLSPTERNLINLTGAQNVCSSNVGDYNQMATNATTKQWIPVELPTVVGNDSATDCKPDNAPSPAAQPAATK